MPTVSALPGSLLEVQTPSSYPHTPKSEALEVRPTVGGSAKRPGDFNTDETPALQHSRRGGCHGLESQLQLPNTPSNLVNLQWGFFPL